MAMININGWRLLPLVIITVLVQISAVQADQELPDTGISGVYEVMVGTADATPVIEYFAQFGFSEVARESISAQAASELYGVNSALTSVRMQNGKIDSHGLLRILEWEKPLGPGVGYAPPETVGQRMAVMRTRDIFRLHDVYTDLRDVAGEPWLPTPPVYDNLYDMGEGKPGISNRRVGVREMGVYGQPFNHVFYQRYGYRIPGYGTISADSPLQTSEFTHHDFAVTGDLGEISEYYASVLGLRPENDPVIDGDWQAGPRTVFIMAPGSGHWYRGFVSPNNICGKIKLFSPVDPGSVRDRSDRQRIGEQGITLHSLYTPKLAKVHGLAKAAGLAPTRIQENEFGEDSFVFRGPDGASWQILEAPRLKSKPVLEFKLENVDN